MSGMLAGVEPTQVLLAATLCVAAGYAWYVHGRGRWWDRLTDRFVYGVPWGTLVSVAGVVAFYLFAQGGLGNWGDPVVVAFRSWSYTYLPGILTSGFAHASPSHLIGNTVGTVVLAPIVEYAWGHYPWSTDESAAGDEFVHAPPSNLAGEFGTTDGGHAATTSGAGGVPTRPWVRALVVFPLAVLVVSLVTSVLALGWSLGFSGTVFAFGGFVVVFYPLTAVVSMFAISGVGITYQALTDPVLRVTANGGSSGPPAWAAVNVQAHLLGFLLGALLGIALLWARNERRSAGRVFLAVLVFGLARNLWVLPWSDGNVFLQYRGLGLVFVLVLTVFVTATVTADETPLVGHDSRLAGSSVTARTALAVGLVLVLGAVAAPSVVGNLPGMADDPVPDGAVEVADYSVAYAEDAAHGRVPSTDSGVIVVSERRSVWTTDASRQRLANSGTATVVVGGIGWRETVTANRTGWNVVGNDSVYVVDLEHDGRRTRSFTSGPSRAELRVANHTVSLAATDEGFVARVARNSTRVATVAVPGENESVGAGPLELVGKREDGSLSLFATADGTRVEIASRES